MYVDEFSVLNFRNIKNLKLKLSPGTNIFYGDNGQGKTNILEALYLCATGRSHRTQFDSQLIMFGEKEAHIQSFIEKNNFKDRIDIHLHYEGNKGIAVNSIPVKKSGELFGTVRMVIFSPEDLKLIKNAPSDRRRFMDMELCQLNKVYYYNLRQYYRILKQRNNLLKNIQKNPNLKDTVFVWDKQLSEVGSEIIIARQAFIENLSVTASKSHKAISGEKEDLTAEYKPNCNKNFFEEKLKNTLERDIITGVTGVGPHKDDIVFYVNGKDVKTYGSQGQQRLAALSVKLSEIEIIKNETGEIPVLLLDDVFSELDEKRQFFLLENINDLQVILTCSGVEDILKKLSGEKVLYHVSGGSVKRQ